MTIFVFIIFSFIIFVSYFIPNIPTINKIFLDEKNNLIIKYNLKNITNDNIYCLFKNKKELPSTNDKDWILSKNNECSTLLLNDSSYYVYIKNESDSIILVNESSNFGKIIDIIINKEKIYLAKSGTYQLNIDIKSVGNVNKEIKWYSDNEKIATVDSNGKVTGISYGEVLIHAKVGNIDKTCNVLVTNVITSKPKKFNSKKSYLPCGKYNKEENDLLDTILADRINDAGYKTRAGAVEAARFLALEFPYKIRYFSENGRLSINKVDAEGRYYHKGLYLDESRFSSIKKKGNGPKTWGCSMYCNVSHGYRSNGLDCSGFVSWALLNGGFNVGDVGAGLSSNLDLTDYGKRTVFTEKVVKSGKVKVGDLLSSGGVSGGHIAIIVGEDDKYYYVAESLWTPPTTSVVIIGYSKKNLFKRYYYVMLMDSYYKEDGNLTKLWY